MDDIHSQVGEEIRAIPTPLCEVILQNTANIWAFKQRLSCQFPNELYVAFLFLLQSPHDYQRYNQSELK